MDNRRSWLASEGDLGTGAKSGGPFAGKPAPTRGRLPDRTGACNPVGAGLPANAISRVAQNPGPLRRQAGSYKGSVARQNRGMQPGRSWLACECNFESCAKPGGPFAGKPAPTRDRLPDRTGACNPVGAGLPANAISGVAQNPGPLRRQAGSYGGKAGNGGSLQPWNSGWA